MLKTTLLKTYPSVCAVRKNYIICIPVKKQVIMKITIGNKEYFNHANGVKISNTDVQKFTVPMSELDKYKKYTVTYEEMIKRLDYESETGEPVRIDFNFRPVENKENIKIFHLSDVHGRKTGALKCAENIKDDFDLFILNGDISSSSEYIGHIMLSFILAGEITKGEIPVIISRGNHDLRGKLAEKLPDYMPTDNGKTYYPVTLGPLWFLLLDCGEDKVDGHIEYGHTVCCHQFRLDQSEMLENIKINAYTEHNAENIKYKILLSHVPFENNCKDFSDGEQPFDIEHEIYTHWCDFVRDTVKADFHLFGHIHTLKYFEKNSVYDDKGINIPGISGGMPTSDKNVAGALITLNKNKITVEFRDSDNKILGKNTFKI